MGTINKDPVVMMRWAVMGALDQLGTLFIQLLSACSKPPELPLPRFRSFHIAPGVKLYSRQNEVTQLFHLELETPSETYIIRAPSRLNPNASAAEVLLYRLDHRPNRVWRACKVLESAARWFEARIAGVERARQHLLQQQAQALQEIETLYTLLFLGGE